VKEPIWVGRNVVVAFHERLISEHGGAGGIRDAALLDSALARSQNLMAYGKPNPFELAACYAFGLVKNHPFFDGNKRIGFAVAVLFLELNGWRFTAAEVEVVLQTLASAAGEISEGSYAEWMKNNSTVTENE
jgi:death on curing protein